MVGIGAIESLKNYRFDKCFMGVNGIHPQFGYTTPDQEEAAVKQISDYPYRGKPYVVSGSRRSSRK